MFECPACGKSISNDAAFCPYCGKKDPTKITVYGVAEKLNVPRWAVPIVVVVGLFILGQLMPSETKTAVTASASSVALSPTAVTLDYASGEMEIRGTLTHTAGPVPHTVWMWAYFVNPSVAAGGSWSDQAIAVRNPFANGTTVAVQARGPFHWATNPDLPRTGFYAWITVSAVSAAAAQVPPSQRNLDPAGAMPVGGP